MFSDGAIVAQASAHGTARRGIIRLSGDSILNAVAPFFLRKEKSSDSFPPAIPANQNCQGRIVEDTSKTAIIDGWFAPWGTSEPDLVVPCALFYWPKGRGFTGEQAVELHLPGSPPILDAVARTICETKFARLATRGEFTLRAFLSGRIDLTQAEAVLGAIDASSDAELQTALAQLSGMLSREFSNLREKLMDVLCDLEAGFDFVEEDIEFVAKTEIKARLLEIKARVEKTLERTKTQLGADRIPIVALVGSPNVGKSSLFNKMLEFFGDGSSSKAIVSNLAGTTRDYLEKELLIDGMRFILVDSAGVENREAFKDVADSLPRERAQQGLIRLFANAEIIVKCDDPTSKSNSREELVKNIIPSNTPLICVTTKQDLSDHPESVGNENIPTSSVTGFGIEQLGKRIVETLRKYSENGEMTASTAIRCQDALREAAESLQNALNILDDDIFLDDFILASEIRVALDRIGIVTGQVHTDDLLDRIFSRFCIGK